MNAVHDIVISLRRGADIGDRTLKQLVLDTDAGVDITDILPTESRLVANLSDRQLVYLREKIGKYCHIYHRGKGHWLESMTTEGSL